MPGISSFPVFTGGLEDIVASFGFSGSVGLKALGEERTLGLDQGRGRSRVESGLLRNPS